MLRFNSRKPLSLTLSLKCCVFADVYVFVCMCTGVFVAGEHRISPPECNRYGGGSGAQ